MLRLHEDPAYFAEALNFTEAETSFAARLVEKDYYCTVLLEYLTEATDTLVFKGGTCLAKIHADFFRLSEDLDFMIPVSENNTRGSRRKAVMPIKDSLVGLETALPCFRMTKPLSGANKSTQYMGSVVYSSTSTGQEETIKIEVSLREPLLTPAVPGKAGAILIDPITGNPLVAPVSVACMSLAEAYAEKFRAALSRLDAAIRDFFDLDYAVRNSILKPDNAQLVELVRQKLAVPGTGSVDISERRMAVLRQQVEAQLRPVLRRKDFAGFNIDRAFQLVADIAEKVG